MVGKWFRLPSVCWLGLPFPLGNGRSCAKEVCEKIKFVGGHVDFGRAASLALLEFVVCSEMVERAPSSSLNDGGAGECCYQLLREEEAPLSSREEMVESRPGDLVSGIHLGAFGQWKVSL
jgi:hypothetical protein